MQSCLFDERDVCTCFSPRRLGKDVNNLCSFVVYRARPHLNPQIPLPTLEPILMEGPPPLYFTKEPVIMLNLDPSSLDLLQDI